MTEKRPINLPKHEAVYCPICMEQVTEPFVASKPRKGPAIYIHTECFNQEQKELKGAKA